MIDSTDPDFWPDLAARAGAATGETFYMVLVSLLLTTVIGLLVGLLIVTTDSGGVLAKPFGSRALGRAINRALDLVVNVGRSVPFIILMFVLIPVTRALVGTFIGPTASVVPLTVAGVPFFARLVEIALREVPAGVVEAAESLGATRTTVLFKVLVAEAVPGIMLGLSTTVVSLISFSAMVGAVGGGGLGDLAYRYGYQRYSGEYMAVIVVILIVIVQVLQSLGNWAARRISHR